mmetsp:Transcript_16470/g.29945  ORF Transcript_16470/g.29945 Transcript_16470/m.29945 type:complete len:180 (-) Transcript_16470:1671-2210(-)
MTSRFLLIASILFVIVVSSFCVGEVSSFSFASHNKATRRNNEKSFVPFPGRARHCENRQVIAKSGVNARNAAGNVLTARGGSIVATQEEQESEESRPGMWPCLDELDQRIIKISLPCIANFAIAPLIGAVDLFWVNRMRNTLAVAGQAAANQVFSSAFFLVSFMPSGKKAYENDIIQSL